MMCCCAKPSWDAGTSALGVSTPAWCGGIGEGFHAIKVLVFQPCSIPSPRLRSGAGAETRQVDRNPFGVPPPPVWLGGWTTADCHPAEEPPGVSSSSMLWGSCSVTSAVIQFSLPGLLLSPPTAASFHGAELQGSR